MMREICRDNGCTKGFLGMVNNNRAIFEAMAESADNYQDYLRFLELTKGFENLQEEIQSVTLKLDYCEDCPLPIEKTTESKQSSILSAVLPRMRFVQKFTSSFFTKK